MVEKFLTDEGLTNPTVKIKQLIATDLDGDGRQEVIINGLNTARGDTKRGEYSVVLLQRETANKFEIVELAKSISLKDENVPSLLVEHTVVSVLDLDNDGNAELIMYGAFTFGEGWEVLKIKGKKTEQVLFCGCG